jgi:phenylalanyl-tRNA synthetase beta chain
MRFPLSWLKLWVPDLPADLNKVSELLMRAGIGLEAVENPAAALQHVVVAKVLERNPHPNADKLSVCKVSDGSATYQIVCGAQNYQAGSVVPLAKEGANLPGDFKIKKGKIRGEVSEGMLCAAQELGLPDKTDGLMILDPGLKLGTPLAEALGLDDAVLTLETTANRPDHLSVRGLAREVAALGGFKLGEPDHKLPTEPGSASFQVSVDADACPYYTVRLLKGVKVGPSPAWLQQRLEKSGVRAISNVVDATNYILLEYGQPMHAFDAAKLSGAKLEARLAKAGEKIKTLDGQDRELLATDIVIVDGAGPQALGGVMGGAHSEVTGGTTDLVLEAAVFLPKLVRRTSRRLGLISESSHRFERGVDPRGVDAAMDRCAALILEIAGGSLASPRLKAGSPGAAPAPLSLDPAKVNALLGTQIDGPSMAKLLERRFYQVAADGAGFKVTPPAWRRDVKLSVDLAEEVLQMAGLDALPSSDLPQVRTPDADDVLWSNAWLLRRTLSGLGLNEASTLSYLDPKLAEAWGMAAGAWRLDNPLSEEQSLLRPSLLPNLVDAALGALKRRQPSVAFYELGRSFGRKNNKLEESERLAIVVAGEAVARAWNAPARDRDYFDLKGLAEALAHGLGVTFRCSAAKTAEIPAWAHPGQCARVSVGGLFGTLASLHPSLLKALDAPKDLGGMALLELELLAPGKALAKEPKYTAFSRVPAVERDLSCLMDRGVEAGAVLDFIRKEGGLGEARVLDRFEGQPLPDGKKSLTFRVTYTAEGRSLTDAEVNQRHEELMKRLETALPVELRR